MDPVSHGWDSLRKAMGEIEVKGATGYSFDSRGNKIYEASQKRYISLDDQKKLVLSEHKGTKAYSMLQVAETIKKVVVARFNSTTTQSAPNQLEIISFLDGLDVLKGRIVAARDSESLISRLFKKLFGSGDQYEAALREIHQAEGTLRRQLKTEAAAAGGIPPNEQQQRRLIFGMALSETVKLDELMERTGLDEAALRKELEGGELGRNMEYLVEHLEGEITKVRTSPSLFARTPGYLDKLIKLKGDLERSIAIAAEIQQLHLKPTPEQRKKIEELIAKQLAKMQPGERLIIPVGTRDHVASLVLCKAQDGKIKPTLYNTGEGIEHHHHHGSKYATSQSYMGGGVEHTTKGVMTLLDIKVRSAPESDGGYRYHKEITDMYKTLSDAFGMRTSVGVPKKVSEHGTCSFQCLDEFCREALGKESYHAYRQRLLSRIRDDFRALPHSSNARLDDLHRILLEKTVQEIDKSADAKH